MDEKYLKRVFQIHLTRSFGPFIVIAAANTGREAMPTPEERNDARHNEFDFPTCRRLGDASWDTRFDGGQSCMDPSVIVALEARVGISSEDQETPYVADVFARLVYQESARGHSINRAECYLVHRYPGRLATIDADGLTAVEQIVKAVAHHKKELDEATSRQAMREGWGDWEVISPELLADLLPPGTKAILDKATKHVQDSFGQGGDFFKNP